MAKEFTIEKERYVDENNANLNIRDSTYEFIAVENKESAITIIKELIAHFNLNEAVKEILHY